MANVLTVGSNVQCSHGGAVTLKAGQTKLKVDGKAVLRPMDLVGASIVGCAVPVATSPPAPSPTSPCMTVLSVTAGSSTNLRIAGVPVLLDTARGLTDGVPPPSGPFNTWSVHSAGQSKLAAK
jgi:hypothetical protein